MGKDALSPNCFMSNTTGPYTLRHNNKGHKYRGCACLAVRLVIKLFRKKNTISCFLLNNKISFPNPQTERKQHTCTVNFVGLKTHSVEDQKT